MRFLRFLPRFREAYRAVESLSEREDWTRAEIESYQLERINVIWQRAITHVPYYRRLRETAGLPPHFASVEEYRTVVPVLPCARVRSDPESFLAEGHGRGHWKKSSGSTGNPGRFFWDHDAYLKRLQFKYRFKALWGLDIFERMAFIWGHRGSFAGGIRGRMARIRQPLEDRLRNRIRLSAYRTNRDELRSQLRRIAAFRPVAVYGYSFVIYLLAREAQSMGFECDSLKLFILTAEPAYPHIVKTVEAAFGVPAVSEYGSAETGPVAAEWPDRTLRVREDWALLETLPRDDGRFDIVVTLLHNPSFPLVRYAIGDVTDAALELPDRGFAILSNVAGRDNDFVVSRSGESVHCALLGHIVTSYDAIQCYHIHQRVDGSLSVTVQLREATAVLDAEELKRKIESATDGWPVELDIVDAIPRSPAGKLRYVVSDLAANRETIETNALLGGEHR